jgi:hypothetical protein
MQVKILLLMLLFMSSFCAYCTAHPNKSCTEVLYKHPNAVALLCLLILGEKPYHRNGLCLLYNFG